MFNNGINRFNLSPAQLKRINNQPKAEEKKEEKPAEKLEAQKQQIEPHKVSSAEVLNILSEMQKDAVVNTPKTRATEGVALKQSSSGARTETTEEVDENGNKTVTTKEYNKYGELLKEVIEKYDKDGDFLGKEIITYYRNYKGDIYKKVTEVYDKSGNLIEETTENFYPDYNP